MILTAAQVRQILRERVEAAGSQGKAAQSLHVTREYLNEVLRGKHENLGFRIPKMLGLRRVIAYERVEE